jgi:hypothetical protein
MRDLDEDPAPPRAVPTASAMPRPGGATPRGPGRGTGGFALRALGGGGLLGSRGR